MSPANLDLPVLMSGDQIRRREFVAIRRGYDPGQVREFLEQVADHVQQMESVLQEAKLEATSAIRAASQPRTDPYTQLAERVADVLRSADEEADKARRDARAEAEHILSEAREDADRIREDARVRAEEARAEADRTLREARDQADRTITGLSTKRDALVDQLASMQERLVGVARDLESTISMPDVPELTDLLGPTTAPSAVVEGGSEESAQAWALPSTETAEVDDEDEPDARTIVMGEAEPSSSEAEATHGADDPDDPQLGLLTPALEELWEGTDAIGLKIPDIPPLDLDWGESPLDDETDD
jgi:DivIVA domain-containing protein